LTLPWMTSGGIVPTTMYVYAVGKGSCPLEYESRPRGIVPTTMYVYAVHVHAGFESHPLGKAYRDTSATRTLLLEGRSVCVFLK
jgi:hypothetical protein